ncbi:MAG: M20/M25/M40 family metallo-hydrolase [Thermoprotei archaeon]|nr:M20/M25/M40 family metallo-hydrolase [TACK group archaeon]
MTYNKEEALNSLLEFLKLPSVSATGEGVLEAAEALASLMDKLGFESSVNKTAGNPVVRGEVNVGSERTVLMYNHYDVQPVDPESEWKFPPFSATIEEGKVYARGASDNKGTLMARLFGVKRLMDEGKLGVNVKFLFEGEEEIGSPHLADYVKGVAGELKSDGVLMEGSGLDAKGRPQIILGVKGILYVQIDAKGGSRDIHSSMASLVENPAIQLMKFLSSLVDENGKVTIEGFYDDVQKPDPLFDELLSKLDQDPAELMKSLGVNKLKLNDRESLLRALYAEPTFNVDGFISGYTGPGSKTIIPHSASAKIDFRLVPNQDPYKIFEALRKRMQAFGMVAEIRNLGPEYAARTSPNSRLVRAMESSARRVYGIDPVIIPTSAGTQPMWVFTRIAGIPDAISAIGAGSSGSNAHAPNENISLENYYKAIDHTAEFLRDFAK